jgi:hypothetical protein
MILVFFFNVGQEVLIYYRQELDSNYNQMLVLKSEFGIDGRLSLFPGPGILCPPAPSICVRLAYSPPAGLCPNAPALGRPSLSTPAPIICTLPLPALSPSSLPDLLGFCLAVAVPH